MSKEKKKEDMEAQPIRLDCDFNADVIEDEYAAYALVLSINRGINSFDGQSQFGLF